MKILGSRIVHDGAIKRHQIPARAAIGLLTLLLAHTVSGQAPTLLWSTNVGAKLFGVDAQSNVYANAGTNVIKLNSAGLVLQTNSICPLPGLARLDANGNYYFGGSFDGTQNFGGITLVGGWTNTIFGTGHYTPGYPTLFIAKYNNGGALQWVSSFGQQGATGLRLTDMELGPGGELFVGHIGAGGTPIITKFSSSGSFQWTKDFNVPGFAAMKLGGITSTNLCYVRYGFSSGDISSGRIDYNGNAIGGQTGGYLLFLSDTLERTNGKPVLNDVGQLLLSGITNTLNSQEVLAKFDLNGSLLWARSVGHGPQWPLARDASECFYFGSVSNNVIKYDANGNELWSANYPAEPVKMLVDSSGNRFIGFADGTVAELAADAPPQPPSIVTGPQPQIVSLHSNALFTVSANGSPTLYYQWRKDGTNLVGATSGSYAIPDVSSNHVGFYDVVVTNVYGAVTSTPPAALYVAPSLLSPYTGLVGIWGHEAILSVSAWGSGTLTYQWYKAGQLVSGATNSTLTFPSLQISDAGLYSVVVSSQYSSVTNAPAQLVVNPANISLGLYAGITIEGTAGYTYGIEYTTNLQDPNSWQSVTNVTLTQPVEIWVDTSVKATELPKRYYRVTNQ